MSSHIAVTNVPEPECPVSEGRPVSMVNAATICLPYRVDAVTALGYPVNAAAVMSARRIAASEFEAITLR